MKTIENIFAQEKRIIDAINKEGQALINTTSFEEWDKWDNIQDRLEQISKRRRRVFNISRAFRDQEYARMDCIAGVYDKFYRYNRTDDRHTTRLGELRTKSLRTRQSHSSILNKNMAIKVTRKGIKLKLERPLSAQEIWNRIMDIEIQALEKLLEEKSLSKWKTIFPCYGSSLEYTETQAKKYITIFQGLQGNTYNKDPQAVENMLVNRLNLRWFNTLMSTLFMMEDELLRTSSDSVFELWDLFFTAQAMREENNVVAMGLINLELK